jgi:hypothetical protein
LHHTGSTVWDGADTLFDFNWQAFGIPADRCFRCAHDEVPWFGQRMETQLAEDFSADLNAATDDVFYIGIPRETPQ